MHNPGDFDHDQGIGVSRLKADAVKLQGGVNEFRSYAWEQRRDVMFTLAFLAAVAILMLLVKTWFSRNLIYTIMATPFLAFIVYMPIGMARAKRSQKEEQERQYRQFMDDKTAASDVEGGDK
ncbi:MAG: hypothetical protein R3D32_10355 [Nitratireductor sp.]